MTHLHNKISILRNFEAVIIAMNFCPIKENKKNTKKVGFFITCFFLVGTHLRKKIWFFLGFGQKLKKNVPKNCQFRPKIDNFFFQNNYVILGNS